MQTTNLGSLTFAGDYIANPHLYDYLHRLSFLPTGVVEMIDGAGQRFNSFVKGRYSVESLSQDTAFVAFFDLQELEPWRRKDKIADLEPFGIKVTREQGVFAFREQVIWKIDNEDEWPCFLYRGRYLFDRDPLEPVESGRAGNLYHMLEDEEPDTCSYYHVDDGELITYHEAQYLRELFEQGILL